MNTCALPTTTILINLDLLFDLYSVIFGIYRTYFAKHAIPIHELKHCIEGKSLYEGLDCLISEVGADLKVEHIKEDLHDMIPMSLSSIKPNIGIYALLTDLQKNGASIKVFTHFEDTVLDFIIEAHKSWFQFEILKFQDTESLKTALEPLTKIPVVFIDSSVNRCFEVQKELAFPTIFLPSSKKSWESFSGDAEVKESFIKQSISSYETLDKVEWEKIGVISTVKWPEPSFYLKLSEKPKNLEYNIWGNYTKFEESIELTSNVVHGYGRGGKKLGIPTANLDMTEDIEKKLSNLVSGVYYGWAEFPTSETEKNSDLENNIQYPMVMSIGFNPYFNNKHKTAEAHIMRKFENDFYGSNVTVKILGFIRNEADFMSFSHLIEAIHNDVQLTKDILGVETN